MTVATQNTGWKLVKAEVKELTPELAEQFRKLDASPTERELQDGRVAHLRRKIIELGQAVTFHWSTAKLGSRILRMNGQHSSNMLCGLNGQFPEGLKVHLDEYEVDSKDALALLFRQFDDRKSNRSPSDVAGAYQGLYEPMHNVPRAAAKLAVEGACWYDLKVEGLAPPSGDDQYTRFKEQGVQKFAQWLGELFSIKTPELKRQTIVAAMYGTFTKNEAEARKFWADVARGGEEYEDDAPSTVLDNWLKSLAENKRAKSEMKPANFYQGAIYAWNAYREEKTISSIKFDTKKGMHTVNE